MAARHIRQVRGRYTARRHALAWLGHTVFFALPWLRWRGASILALPGVAWLLALAIVVALIAAAGAVVGRLWCGYACPHTAYAALFLSIERRIEGNRSTRIRRAAAPLALPNLCRKIFKHGAWLMVALLSGFTLAAYRMPAPELLRLLLHGGAPAVAVVTLCAYAAMAYVHGGLQREFLCRYLCPLAPMQRAKRGVAAPLGDCLDCTLCLQVCPTGDDIRAGWRGDCLGCGACIDACDAVMDKRGLRRGLIRYARLDQSGQS
jgi:polyferredoxin